jgi:hypothetical protein
MHPDVSGNSQYMIVYQHVEGVEMDVISWARGPGRSMSTSKRLPVPKRQQIIDAILGDIAAGRPAAERR